MRQSVIALMHNVLRHVGFDLIRYPEPMSFEERLRALLHDVEPDVVVDIGANVGEFGASLRSLGYAGRIVASSPRRRRTRNSRSVRPVTRTGRRIKSRSDQRLEKCV